MLDIIDHFQVGGIFGDTLEIENMFLDSCFGYESGIFGGVTNGILSVSNFFQRCQN